MDKVYIPKPITLSLSTLRSIIGLSGLFHQSLVANTSRSAKGDFIYFCDSALTVNRDEEAIAAPDNDVFFMKSRLSSLPINNFIYIGLKINLFNLLKIKYHLWLKIYFC